MASIARCRDALKSEPLDQSEFVRGYLSKEDLTEAATAAKYRWRRTCLDAGPDVLDVSAASVASRLGLSGGGGPHSGTA